MYITSTKSTANLKPVDNLTVSPDNACQWRAVLTDWTTESGSFWIEAAIVCVLCYQRQND